MAPLLRRIELAILSTIGSICSTCTCLPRRTSCMMLRMIRFASEWILWARDSSSGGGARHGRRLRLGHLLHFAFELARRTSAAVGASATSEAEPVSMYTSRMPASRIFRRSLPESSLKRVDRKGWSIQPQLRSWMNMPGLSRAAGIFLMAMVNCWGFSS
jgi:hypothetical protein